MSLAERLIKLRKEKGLTQLNLAEKLNVSRQAVSRWEAGIAIPSTENLKYLSDLYGVSVDFLFNGSEEGLGPEKERTSGKKEPRKKAVLRGVIVAVCILIAAIALVCTLSIFEEPEDVSIGEIPERSWDRTSGGFAIDW